MTEAYVIDAGNSRIKIGQFSRGRLSAVHTFPKSATEQLYNFLNHCSCDKFIISSVSVNERSFIEALPEHAEAVVLNHSLKLPMTIGYESPDTLGKDRIAAVAGAMSLWKGGACLVVDAGSCVTIDLVNENGHWEGGNISPGLRMRWKAMHRFTDRLPLADMNGITKDVWGTTTLAALGNGGLWGLTKEIEGYFRQVTSRYHSAKLILTGGDAPVLAEFMKTEIFVEPNLVLIGLHEILQHNV
jgi:type III pantothenate kinase